MKSESRMRSAEAFKTIRENGLLSRRRLEVYATIFDHGPLSSNDCFHLIKRLRGTPNMACKSDVRARFTELRELGVIEDVGVKRDPETSMLATVWDVNDRLPAKIPKRKKIECKTCKGKGFYFEGEQGVLNDFSQR